MVLQLLGLGHLKQWAFDIYVIDLNLGVRCQVMLSDRFEAAE